MRYGRRLIFMISKFDELNELFKEIDQCLRNRVHFFIIGGAMLLYHGLKSITKDIDIVVDSAKEFSDVESVLKKIGFIAEIPTLEYKKTDLSQIFVREDFRIDLFQRTVCRGFVLSSMMVKRAKKVDELSHLSILLCSNEDVFLLKTFTDREGDIDDCIALAKMGMDWDAILDEIKRQIRISGKEIWITWIGERLDILEERGLPIPIMADVDKLREEYFDEAEKRLKTKS